MDAVRALVRGQDKLAGVRENGRGNLSGHYECSLWRLRRACSSAGLGPAMISGSEATARSQPVRSLAAAAETPGNNPVTVNSNVTGSGSRTPRSVMIFLGPAPVSPSRLRSPGPDP